MLSSGGAHAGAIWTDVPRAPFEFFQASHFVQATRRRLGVVTCLLGSTCCVQQPQKNAGPVRRCGEMLDWRLTHPTTTCVQHGAKNRAHDFLKNNIAHQLRDAGAFVDIERCVPDLVKETDRTDGGIDAIMDVVAAFPNATRQHWIDVTVRSPHAERYNTSGTRNACNCPGFAATKGAEDKWERYQSEDVIPIAFETYGRIAVCSMRKLEELSIIGATLSLDRWTTPMLLSKWLRHAIRSVIWAAADTDLLALGSAATLSERVIARQNMARSARLDSSQGRIEAVT